MRGIGLGSLKSTFCIKRPKALQSRINPKWLPNPPRLGPAGRGSVTGVTLSGMDAPSFVHRRPKVHGHHGRGLRAQHVDSPESGLFEGDLVLKCDMKHGPLTRLWSSILVYKHFRPLFSQEPVASVSCTHTWNPREPLFQIRIVSASPRAGTGLVGPGSCDLNLDLGTFQTRSVAIPQTAAVLNAPQCSAQARAGRNWGFARAASGSTQRKRGSASS